MSSYPPPPPPGYGSPPGPFYGPTRSTNGKAIAALVCGIAGFVVCPLIAVVAVILGPQAKREIAAEPDRYEGEGLAKAGQIIGWICLALTAVATLGVIVIIIIAAATESNTSFESLASLVG